MRKLSLIILTLFIFFAISSRLLFANEENYKVLDAQSAAQNAKSYENSSKVLFIVDYSNSMNDKIGGKTKLQIAISTIEELLTKIPSTTQVGLRIYGHRQGITYMDGCTATKLLVPIAPNNAVNIQGALYSSSAKGWTPITYSLKQAVNKDFAGVTGEKRIILLTDGGENCDESPCTYAISLMKERSDIKIDVIALDIYDAEANNQLRCTALTTSGKFYSANTQQDLKESLYDSLNVDKDVRGSVKIK